MTPVQSVTRGGSKLPEWYCNSKCRIVLGGAGPWSDSNKEFFFRMKSAHSDCIGFQVGTPKLRGKINWGYTETEKETTKVSNQIIDRLFHELVALLKGPEKVCLIKDKWKYVNEI